MTNTLKAKIRPIIQLKGKFSKPDIVKDDNIEYLSYEEVPFQYVDLSEYDITSETVNDTVT